MQSIKAIVAYKGTAFSGWQIQENAKTIQAILTKTISKKIGASVLLTGASRTDAGVHARGQVICIRYDGRFPVDKLCQVVNKALPKDIALLEATSVDSSFHPIVDAISKIYHYEIDNTGMKSPFNADLCWAVRKPLDLIAMREAAALLVGTHDYAAFCASGSNAKSTVRTVYRIDIEGSTRGQISLKFHGNGFLYNMIRIMTAVLVKVGEGTLKPEDANEILKGKDRLKAPWTAPAEGLYLQKIFYSEVEESEYFQGTKKI